MSESKSRSLPSPDEIFDKWWQEDGFRLAPKDKAAAIWNAAFVLTDLASYRRSPTALPALWWNGFRKADVNDLTYPSVSEREDTNHDIPLYAGANPHSELTKDAARYRAMRASAEFQDRNGPGLYWYLPRTNRDLPIGERLDAALDATMAADRQRAKE